MARLALGRHEQPQSVPGCGQDLLLAYGALLASVWLGRWGSHRLLSGLKGRWQCSGDFLGVRMQPFSSGSFWWAKGAVGCRLERPHGLWGSGGRGSSDAASVWEVSAERLSAVFLPLLL